MIGTSPAIVYTFLDPFGNSQAKCLTQDIPASEDANILLLGCGDERSILYTAYNEKASSQLIIKF